MPKIIISKRCKEHNNILVKFKIIYKIALLKIIINL